MQNPFHPPPSEFSKALRFMLASFDSNTPASEMPAVEDAVMHEVIAWLERGDQAAARRIVERLAPLVRGIAFQKLPRAWMVEDAVQSTLASVFHSLDTFDARVPLSAWAVHIAKNVCSNVLRSWRRRTVFSAAEMDVEHLHEFEYDEAGPSLDAEIMAREELRMVLQCVAQLDAKDRLVVVMLFITDCPAAEVGRRIGLSAGAVRVRACRIRSALREGLASHGV